VTLRHPDSAQYRQFARRVRQRAVREYGYDVYGDEVDSSQYSLAAETRKLERERKLENKLPSIEDRGQTDSVTILANPNPDPLP